MFTRARERLQLNGFTVDEEARRAHRAEREGQNGPNLTKNEILEKAVIKTDLLTGQPNINLEDEALHYFTNNATGNWTFNMRGGASTTLNSMMNTGDTMTVSLLTTQGGTAYYMNGFKIDGTTVTVKWANDTAISAGTANAIDVYTFSILKTGNAAYTVLGSMSTYG